MRIYQKSGYIDIRSILSTKLPFIFIVGGRATGKTYTSLETVIDDNIKFMYMRRTQSQADIIAKPEFSPFKPLNAARGWTIGVQSVSKYSSGFYDTIEEDGKTKCVGDAYGYTCALSTIANMRGFDASDMDILIYDEFIPESHERPLKNECAALLNAYETMNRNRELNGRDPLQLLCLANANNLGNPIFEELGLIRKAETMRRRKQEVSIDRDRGIGLFILSESKISAQKANTALYKIAKGSKFYDMSINNDFWNENDFTIHPEDLREYKPVCTVGDITIYTHKSESKLYVSTHRSGNPPKYGTTDIERQRFRRDCIWIWVEYVNGNIIFEEYLCGIKLTNAFKL